MGTCPSPAPVKVWSTVSVAAVAPASGANTMAIASMLYGRRVVLVTGLRIGMARISLGLDRWRGVVATGPSRPMETAWMQACNKILRKRRIGTPPAFGW
jgi:hypothetical protein